MAGRCRLSLRCEPASRMVDVVSTGEGDEKAGVGDPLHEGEKPLRREKSSGPATAPAKRRKPWPSPLALAFSNWSRTSLPWDTPLRAAATLSQAAISSLRRIEIV